MDDDRSAHNDRLSLKLVAFHHLPVANLPRRPSLLPNSGPGGSLEFETSDSSTTKTIAEPSLTLGLPCSDNAGYAAAFPYSDPHESMVSSLAGGQVKRETIADEEELLDGVAGARKKLRLTKEQSAVLEDKFKEHATLNLVCKSVYSSNIDISWTVINFLVRNHDFDQVNCKLMQNNYLTEAKAGSG